PAIRAAAQGRRIDGMKFGVLVGADVRRFDAGHARVVVVKLPGGELAVSGDGAFDFNHASGTEVGPGELFLASPDDFDGIAGGASEARGLERGIAGVLATVCGASVRNDHTDGAFRHVKRSREVVADGEWALRTGPDGELVAGPLGK